MNNEWMKIRTCTSLHEAAFFKSVLDAAGIQSFIPNEHTLGVSPLLGEVLGGVQVMVRQEDFKRAVELLDSALPATADADEDDE